MARALSVKAPGRICFFGDHQDYLGLPVIAATIDRYIYMEATPKEQKTLSIELLDLDLRFSRFDQCGLDVFLLRSQRVL